MARTADKKETIILKNPTKQKFIVAQGRTSGFNPIPYKLLHTEIVPSKEAAIEREKELREEYKDIEALSICYFSM